MPGANPFLDQTTGGGQYGFNGQGYYAPDQTTPEQVTGGYGNWRANPSTAVDTDNGTQRAKSVGQYVHGLMGRQGPTFQGQSTYDINQARAQQQQALGLARNFAMGQGPSVAQAQTYGGLGQNIAAMNAASQGRGGAARAMGAGFGAGNQVAMQGANARAQEQAGLMNMYGGGTNALRGADVSQFGTAQQNLARGNDLATQQGILNAQTGFQAEQMEEQNEVNNESYLQALSQQNQQSNNQLFSQGMQDYAMVAGAMAGVSDRRAKTDVRHSGLMGNY